MERRTGTRTGSADLLAPTPRPPEPYQPPGRFRMAPPAEFSGSAARSPAIADGVTSLPTHTNRVIPNPRSGRRPAPLGFPGTGNAEWQCHAFSTARDRQHRASVRRQVMTIEPAIRGTPSIQDQTCLHQRSVGRLSGKWSEQEAERPCRASESGAVGCRRWVCSGRLAASTWRTVLRRRRTGGGQCAAGS